MTGVRCGLDYSLLSRNKLTFAQDLQLPRCQTCNYGFSGNFHSRVDRGTLRTIKMQIDIELSEKAPEREEMNAILREYYNLLIGRLVADGGPQMTPDGPIEDFWTHVAEFLPPAGRLALARKSNGLLVGCGTLASIGHGRGELKRLFVRPEARGTGLGRRLVELRIDEARAMGLRTLLVDTLRLNVEMRGLYAKLGFWEIPPYPESATVQSFPDLAPFMIFLQLDIS